jgi:hypothetical protein
MSRINLTLDADTDHRLEQHARRAGLRITSFARQLIREALDRREQAARRRKLAADYAADREDATALLREMETAQYGYGGEEDEV